MRPVLICLLLASCASRTVPIPAPTPDPVPEAAAAVALSTEPSIEAQLLTGNLDFAGDLYRRLSDENPDANLFFSPTSVSVALGMTWAGAAGQTRTDMASALHFPDNDALVHGGLSTLLTSWNSDDERPFELTVANHLWAQEGVAFEDAYLGLVERYYGGGLERLDLQNQPEPSRQHINRWVSDQTRERIPELLPEGILTSNSALVLTNAVYFLGSWQVAFDAANTKVAPFETLAGPSVDAALMHRTGRFAYAEHDGVQVLSLPYEGDRLSMVVLLPGKGELGVVERSLGSDRITELMGELRPVEVRVWLPKFQLDAAYDLVPTLEQLGMEIAFTDRADFSRMSSEPLLISDVIHKSFVKVDEQGTEAAAATAVVISVRSASIPRPVPDFRADHPFVFMIWDHQTRTPLFVGRMADPS